MQVREVMTQHAEWITADISLKEAAQRMRERDIGCLPIGDNDRLVGMLTDRDIACRAVAEGLDPSTTKVSAVMTKGVTWCFDDGSVEDVAEQMEQKQIHHMPVLNQQKRLIGIVSLSDLALRGPQGLSEKFFKLASRDATRHAAGQH
jgi:CBS domain-containing protein